jgi:hypothetical protein
MREAATGADPASIPAGSRMAALADALAVARAARASRDDALERLARGRARSIEKMILDDLEGMAARLPKQGVSGVAELDRRIGQGDGLRTWVGPHKGKVVQFLGLTPAAGEALIGEASGSVAGVFEFIDRTQPAWHLAWGERSAHSGENLYDYPDHVHGLYRARAVLDPRASYQRLAQRIDLPWCAGDLHFIEKVALALELAPPVESPGIR